MQYREDKISGNKLSILGLGCMRFPISMAETERLILTATDGGVNYFDTAYIYPNSEETLGTILKKYGKRQDVFIATKLPLIMCKGPGDFDRFFDKELERLKTGYIDYYLMHMVTSLEQWEKFCRWGIESWIAGKKKSGRIRQAGFSFHGPQGEFLKVLGAYQWDFCQIQYNYSDENYQAGKTGLKAAAGKNMPVMIMEPLLGGKLAGGLPKEAARLFAKADPSLSPAAWGLRWLWNQSEVTCVLSGMSNAAQMEDNLRSAGKAGPLTGDELAVYAEVTALFYKAYRIKCTGCNYCMPCPNGVNIPGCFAAYNTSFAQNFVIGMQQFITSAAMMSSRPRSPRLCSECGICESRCPQHLPIRRALKQAAGRMESPLIRLALSIARCFFP
jgi:predicted aldo/keto reductase-like oxidoreductase